MIEGRSFNAGLSDARYKYLAKEHDTETGLEWLEARGYDVRIGRFLTIDPLAETNILRSWSPYHYSYDNPMRFADPTGMGPDRKWWQVLSDQWFGSSPFDNAQNGSSTSSTNGQGGNDLDQGSLPRPAVVNQTGGGTVTPYELKRRNASVGRVLLKTISAGVSSRRSLLPMSAKPALMSLVAVSIQPNVAIYLEPDGSQSADIDVFARSNASAYFKVSYTGSASLVMNDGVISSQGFEALPRPSLYDSDWSPVGHVSFALPQDRTRLEMDITVLPTLETTSTKGNWPLQSVSTTVKIR